MKQIDPGTIKRQINKCYNEYDPNWPTRLAEPTMMNGFKYYLERMAGIRLEFEPEIKNGKMGYGMKHVEIVDDPKFTMWLIKWS